VIHLDKCTIEKQESINFQSLQAEGGEEGEEPEPTEE
jgi:hypothetical protein